jgi:predicted small secreted protein
MAVFPANRPQRRPTGNRRRGGAFTELKPLTREFTQGEHTMPTTKMILALLAFGALVACETVQGAGRDLSAAGQTITAESQEVQDEL